MDASDDDEDGGNEAYPVDTSFDPPNRDEGLPPYPWPKRPSKPPPMPLPFSLAPPSCPLVSAAQPLPSRGTGGGSSAGLGCTAPMGCWPLALYEGELSPARGLGLLVQVALARAAPGQGPSSGAFPSERVIEDEEDDDDSDDDEEDCGDGRGAARERLRALHLETATKQWLADQTGDQALPSDAMPTEDMYVQVAVR